MRREWLLQVRFVSLWHCTLSTVEPRPNGPPLHSLSLKLKVVNLMNLPRKIHHILFSDHNIYGRSSGANLVDEAFFKNEAFFIKKTDLNSKERA